MPVLNEAELIATRLAQLKTSLSGDYEIIVVDGGSMDATVERAQTDADSVIASARGRALQMNAGAARAQGDVFLFLHADTSLPANAIDVLTCVNGGWGRFNVRLSGGHFMYRVIERMMNFRSCLTGVATGDQAMFVSRALFKKVHGFPEIGLMEDIALSKLLRKCMKPLCLRQQVTTSSRRWQQHGIIKTIMLMWWLRLLYFIGVSPSRLANMYRQE